MSLQSIVNSAQSVEINRSALVATSVSRSGRLFTASRNWVKPWRFTIEPRPIWDWTEGRPIVESVMTPDKNIEQTITFNGGASWVVGYQGSLSSPQLAGLTVNGASLGTLMRLNLSVEVQALPADTVLFKTGDLIQPVGHRYPYVITSTVTRGAASYVDLTLNRGILPQTGYSIAGAGVVVGNGCTWRVKISNLPTYRMLPSQRVEFTSAFELVENVLGV
jgi:hypothetical protein